MTENYPIDFVIMWVDGNDPAWREESSKYYREETGVDASTARVREWDNLQYWFRSVEKFTPWVNKIHFVTWGHLPKWLNAKHPKLHIVKHGDYIPKEYLPTFSTMAICLNLHRIEGLSEHFVTFDDDMFIGYETDRTRFFRKGLPVDFAQLTPLTPILPFAHYTLNCVAIIQQRHNILSSILKNPYKWFCPKYGVGTLLKNASLVPWSTNVGFKNPHIATPYLRSTHEKLWKEEFSILDASSRNKFRNYADVYDWLMRYEQLVTGNFVPNGIRDTRVDTISDTNAYEIANYIVKQKYRLFCINDSNDIKDFEKCKGVINAAFEKILPTKCTFEI
ncbi:MAG: Stealth CR1 domain-containing protein [Bacteroidales bacterium]|jgi:hypothetical protein|nr:Stealth CR1 domain-containing protein [Bacteroidales bacterium]